MKFFSPLVLVAIVVAASGLTSCGSSGSVDLKYPTVQQMDDMDVQWGLPRRKPRGTPSRSMIYNPALVQPGSGAGASVAVEAPVMPDPVLEASPGSSPAPAPAPVIPDQLR